MNPRVGEPYNNPVPYTGGQTTEAIIVKNTVQMQAIYNIPPAGYYRGQSYNTGFNPPHNEYMNGYN
jgi:hypothetical protein